MYVCISISWLLSTVYVKRRKDCIFSLSSSNESTIAYNLSCRPDFTVQYCAVPGITVYRWMRCIEFGRLCLNCWLTKTVSADPIASNLTDCLAVFRPGFVIAKLDGITLEITQVPLPVVLVICASLCVHFSARACLEHTLFPKRP